jgi:hypothetical protein
MSKQSGADELQIIQYRDAGFGSLGAQFFKLGRASEVRRLGLIADVITPMPMDAVAMHVKFSGKLSREAPPALSSSIRQR